MDTVLARIRDCIDPGSGASLPRVTGGMPRLPSALAVDELIQASVAAASIQAALLTDRAVGTIDLHGDRVRTAVTSDRHFRLDGRAIDPWAEFSGFWQTGDGWLRTHGNYAHHRDRLLGAVGLDAGATREKFAARLAELSAQAAEQRVTDAGGVAVKVRTADEWRRHPHAAFVDRQPLISMERRGRAGRHHADPQRDTPAHPLTGVRVLDLTRVIAGPVTTRSLALLGADVLRVDDPALEEPEWQHLDTGAGKRTTLLDLDSAADRATFDELLRAADVLVTGYRNGALDRFGLSGETLAADHPGLIVGRVSAWGSDGPWAPHRGFDSIVQAATGIAWIEAETTDQPGALPAQALDHSAGYLLAAAILAALRHRRTTGESSEVAVSLARIAHELLRLPTSPGTQSRNVRSETRAVTTTTMGSSAGALTIALPAIRYPGGPEDWPAPSRPYGADAPTWETA